MIKVLYYIYGLNIGGAESFLYNTLKSMQTDGMQFDFCVQADVNTNEKLINLIRSRNGVIHHITPYNKNVLKNKKDFESLLKRNDYSIVHFHFNSLINAEPVFVCENHGIKYVLHSHSTRSNAGKVGQFLHVFNSLRLSKKQIERVACGKEAGEWFFRNLKFTVIQNGISVGDYTYSASKRDKIRSSLNIDQDSMVVGHIGRFTYAKNHNYILQIFKELLKIGENSFLILVGDGELRAEINKQIETYNIGRSVLLTGSIQNVADYLSAFDVMLFPSHFEGIPYAIVEAQAAGLPVLCSDTISRDVKVSDLVEFKALEDDTDLWVKEIIKLYMSKRDRKSYYDIVKRTPYNAEIAANQLIEMYERLGNQQRKKGRTK